jgi:hypothetical protein
MPCALCQVRRPKRFCPGVRGDICTICCWTEREMTVACPLDCEYLQDARQHEKAALLDPGQVPNRDVQVNERLLHEHSELIAVLVRTLLESALKTAGVADFDLRDALEALIRTYRTLQSGIYYETRPENALAGEIFGQVQGGLEEFRSRERQEQGRTKTRDSDVLHMLVFLQRLEFDRNNGRRKGRAFIDLLRSFQSTEQAGPGITGSPLILP